MGNKIGRNQPCPCGSGLKFKKCCGGINGVTSSLALPQKFTCRIFGNGTVLRNEYAKLSKVSEGLSYLRSFRTIKLWRSGIGFIGRQSGKTFPDFLGGYIAQILGSEWGNTEIAKPIEERHPIMQWYDAYCQYQKTPLKSRGDPYNAYHRDCCLLSGACL